MKIIDKFLTLDILKKVNHKINVFAKEQHYGYTNLSWNENLRKDSSLVFIMPFREIEKQVKDLFVSELNDSKLEDMTFSVQMYVWFRGSLIHPHGDKGFHFAATIYLNKRWEIDNGGLFLYNDDMAENKSLQVIVPKYNMCVINDNSNIHMVSQISQNAPTPRFTLQVFVSKPNINNLHY